jgi:citrate lyase subunit gamma (acyl carrier protein)
MDIVTNALAGTLESSDALVRVAPHEEDRLEVDITSDVMRQFGRQIRRVVEETLGRLGVARGRVVVEDKGALDCVLKARVQAAVLRGAGLPEPSVIDWRDLS